MLGHIYNHDIIKKYIILMGTMLNDIYVVRKDATGNTISQILVPITYGPKEKVIARVDEDPILNRPMSSILPYITYELMSIEYDKDRNLNATGREFYHNPGNKNIAKTFYNPVPFNFNFEINIIIKNVQDGTQIIEQILPFFTPDFTVTVKLISEPEVIKDIPVIFKEHSSIDTWRGSFEERRQLVHTLKFQLKGWLYGPERKNKLIKKVISNIDNSASVIVTPGLTSTGYPTNDPTQSVPYSEIDWDDNYGLIVEREID